MLGLEIVRPCQLVCSEACRSSPIGISASYLLCRTAKAVALLANTKEIRHDQQVRANRHCGNRGGGIVSRVLRERARAVNEDVGNVPVFPEPAHHEPRPRTLPVRVFRIIGRLSAVTRPAAGTGIVQMKPSTDAKTLRPASVQPARISQIILQRAMRT